ncbi:ABC transporter ATP-binding protein [Streptomyces sp. NPDC053048]|uniref:ABC transporter ATP-binding protein n=1 Tax=Streptomyces sp. NPDC053048 TaxID=3365694 RepID=UPI0037D620FB
MAAIEVRDLTKHYGDTVAVEGLSFTVEPGSVVGFLGPNGAGKTTTLRMLLGLVTPTSGTALIRGRPYRRLSQPGRLIGASLDSGAAHPRRTARNHLRVLGRPLRTPEARIRELLHAVGLEQSADRPVGDFSLGMRQRLALATALLGDPRILVVDEPANGLDPEGIHWLRGLLRGLAAEGRAVLVSSHLLSEMQQTVDRVVVIDQGRLVTEGTIAELGALGRQTVSVQSPQSVRLGELLRAAGEHVLVTGPDTLQLPGGWAQVVGHLAAEHGIPLYELHTSAPTLEEIFFSLTGSRTADEATGAGRHRTSNRRGGG